nr:hypothetical protein GCM10025732_55930 [Glycomyces mayteni]
MGEAEARSVTRTGTLPDGTAWPVPVTLDVPVAIARLLDNPDPKRRVLRITDPEGRRSRPWSATAWTRSGRTWCGSAARCGG